MVFHSVVTVLCTFFVPWAISGKIYKAWFSFICVFYAFFMQTTIIFHLIFSVATPQYHIELKFVVVKYADGWHPYYVIVCFTDF